MKRRLAIARLWYEGNSFSPALTDLGIFRAREWVTGDAAKDFYRGTATEIGAAVTFAETHTDWDCTFLLCTAAPPGGLMTAEAFAAIRDQILQGITAGQQHEKWDAVYLSLHGATVVVDNPTPELELLRAIRAVISDTPLGVSFDLHAHLASEMLDLIDIAAGYKTYPHIDMDATAKLVLDAVTVQAEGKLAPQHAIAKLPAILPSFNMRTTDGPMAELQQLAQAWRDKPGMIDVSLFGGFAYGDSPFAGPSIIACADNDKTLAQAAVDDLAHEMTTRRDRFYVSLPGPGEGLLQAIKVDGSRPVAVIDPADNPLSGGIGDTPELFRALLDLRPNVPTVFGFFWDPALVARCWQAGAGTIITASLGGRVSQQFGAPVAITARIDKLTDGQFRNLGRWKPISPSISAARQCWMWRGSRSSSPKAARRRTIPAISRSMASISRESACFVSRRRTISAPPSRPSPAPSSRSMRRDPPRPISGIIPTGMHRVRFIRWAVEPTGIRTYSSREIALSRDFGRLLVMSDQGDRWTWTLQNSRGKQRATRRNVPAKPPGLLSPCSTAFRSTTRKPSGGRFIAAFTTGRISTDYGVTG